MQPTHLPADLPCPLVKPNKYITVICSLLTCLPTHFPCPLVKTNKILSILADKKNNIATLC